MNAIGTRRNEMRMMALAAALFVLLISIATLSGCAMPWDEERDGDEGTRPREEQTMPRDDDSQNDGTRDDVQDDERDDADDGKEDADDDADDGDDSSDDDGNGSEDSGTDDGADDEN